MKMLVKRGALDPTISDLANYELGWATGSQGLFINNNGTILKLNGGTVNLNGQTERTLFYAPESVTANRVVKTKASWNAGEDPFEFLAIDSSPTLTSNNLVTSDGVKAALDALQGTINTALANKSDLTHTHEIYDNEKSGWEPDVSYTLSITENVASPVVSWNMGAGQQYWSNGTKYTVNSGNITLTNATSGRYFIYAKDGTISYKQTPWDRSDGEVPLAVVVWNATQQKKIILGYEAHQWVMDWATHLRLHEAGTLYKGGGDLLQINTTTVQVSQVLMSDEDVKLQTGVNVGVGQQLNALSAPIFYKSGATGEVAKIDSSTATCYITGGAAQVNIWNGSSWVLQDVNNNKYFAYWLIHTNDYDESFTWKMGQAEGDSLQAAKENNSIDILDLDGMEIEEGVIVGRLLMQRNGTSYDIIEWEVYKANRDGSSTINLQQHVHVEADITNLDKYTQAQVDAFLDAKLSLSGGLMTGTISRFEANGDYTVLRFGHEDSAGQYNWQINYKGSTSGATGNTLEIVSENGSTFKFDHAGDFYSDGVKFSKEGHTHSYLSLSGGTVNGNVTINGNLTVIGTSTKFEVNELDVDDPMIVVNAALTGDPDAAPVNSGLEVERGTGSNVFIFWGESVNKWQITNLTGTFDILHTGNHIAGSDYVIPSTLNNYLPLAGGTMTGAITMGSYDLIFKGSDTGDIIWRDASNVEQHRLYNNGAYLGYRYQSGTTYEILHKGNLTKSLIDALNIDAETLDGLDSSQFIRSDATDYASEPLYLRRPLPYANGIPTNNLGSPTIQELAMFDEQFNNKTAFYDITKLKFFTSPDGINWTEDTQWSDTNKRKFLGGDVNSGIYIPHGTNFYRLELDNDGTYVYLNALYMYWSSNGNSTSVKIEKYDKNVAVDWQAHTTSDTTVSSWPGHMYLPFNTIPFSQGSTTSHRSKVAIIFEPTWSHASNNISLYKMQIWGGYPAGKRNIYTTNEYGDITFPSEIFASKVWDNGQRVYSANYDPGLIYATGEQDISGLKNFSTHINFTQDVDEIITFDDVAFIKRLSANGGASIGRDDILILGAGEMKSLIESNTSHSEERVHIGGESGVRLYSSPDNNASGWGGVHDMLFDTVGSLSIDGYELHHPSRPLAKMSKYRGTITDFDTAFEPGQYYFSSSAVGGPNDPNYGYLEVIVNNNLTYNGTDNWLYQYIHQTDGRKYYRYKINTGAFTAWYEIYSSQFHHDHDMTAERLYSYGIPGNGTNTEAAFLTIEGNTDGQGEGSGRFFFREHNSTVGAANTYGMSFGYRGGATAITTFNGETWNGLNQIGNGEWGMWGHNASLDGALVMSGDRAATWINFHNNTLKEVGKIEITNVNTWIDEGDGNAVRLGNDSGYVDIGAQNTSYLHVYTDRAEFYFNKEIKINGQNVVKSNDGRLSDARTPLAHNQAWSTITATPTTIAGYGITDAKTATEITNEINAAINALIGGAPGTLDTLNEIAEAINDNADYHTTVTNLLAEKMGIELANGYEGMTVNGLNDQWVRTTTLGIIPYTSGGSSSLGTSSWPFTNVYANNIYDGGTLLENKYAPIGDYMKKPYQLPDGTVSTLHLGALTDQLAMVYHGGLDFDQPGGSSSGVAMTITNDGADGAYGAQFWMSIASDPDVYVRSKVNNVFGSWNRVFTETDPPTAADVGAVADGDYTHHEWYRSYTVTNVTAQQILYKDGGALPAGGTYRIRAHISGTGTDQGLTAIAFNQEGTWYVHNTSQSGVSSNNFELFVDAGVVKIKTWHSSSYTINVYHERWELGEGTGLDNSVHTLGADGFMQNYAGQLWYATDAKGTRYQVFHEGHKPQFTEIQNTPTTLSGYGITNAYTKTEIDAKVQTDVPSGAVFTDTQLSTESVQDIVGAMINIAASQSGMGVTYNDTTGKLDFDLSHSHTLSESDIETPLTGISFDTSASNRNFSRAVTKSDIDIASVFGSYHIEKQGNQVIFTWDGYMSWDDDPTGSGDNRIFIIGDADFAPSSTITVTCGSYKIKVNSSGYIYVNYDSSIQAATSDTAMTFTWTAKNSNGGLTIGGYQVGSLRHPWKLIRTIDQGGTMHSVGSSSSVGSVYVGKSLSQGDIIAIEVNYTSSTGSNTRKIVFVRLGSADSDPTSAYQQTGWIVSTGTYAYTYGFGVSANGNLLYFNYKYYGRISDTTTFHTGYTLYIGNVWLVQEFVD